MGSVGLDREPLLRRDIVSDRSVCQTLDCTLCAKSWSNWANRPKKRPVGGFCSLSVLRWSGDRNRNGEMFPLPVWRKVHLALKTGDFYNRRAFCGV